jgi:uncharacterized protein (DUF58 family)
MTPTFRLLALATGCSFLAVGFVCLPSLTPAWAFIGAACLGAVLIDAFRLTWSPPLDIDRQLPSRLALAQPTEVGLTLRNPGPYPVQIDVFDGIPQSATADLLPWSGSIPPQSEIRILYQIKLLKRGEAIFGPVQIRRLSPFGFWSHLSHYLAPETIRVYPNYEPVIQFALLAMLHRENPLGIVRRPRPGSSRDFHQLRDYRHGDPLSQIDWKASSRRQLLISRDFQEQRNQSVVFMLDTGRRMRALDNGSPQFDHVLNAILLVAYVALRQGDQIAVKSFGGSDRWLPPMKGSHAMPVLLNHLYDYQTTPSPSDFSAAVEQLMARQRRRSLIILLTNLRGEDGNELIPAIQALNSRHLVLLASMRETAAQHAFAEPVRSFESALRFLAADLYLKERREILANLGAAGILTLDSTAGDFPVALANCYVDIHIAGRL